MFSDVFSSFRRSSASFTSSYEGGGYGMPCRQASFGPLAGIWVSVCQNFVVRRWGTEVVIRPFLARRVIDVIIFYPIGGTISGIAGSYQPSRRVSYASDNVASNHGNPAGYPFAKRIAEHHKWMLRFLGCNLSNARRADATKSRICDTNCASMRPCC